MARDLPSGLAAEIVKPVLKPAIAFHIDLDDQVRVWTGVGTIPFTGADWIGAGGIGSFDTVGESSDGSAAGMRVSLPNVPAEESDYLDAQGQRGRLFEVFVLALNESWKTVAGYKRVWKGRLSDWEVVDGGDTLTVNAGAESRAIDQKRPAIKRFDDEYQQRKYPGDDWFVDLAALAEVAILWARGDATGSSATAGGGAGRGR